MKCELFLLRCRLQWSKRRDDEPVRIVTRIRLELRLHLRQVVSARAIKHVDELAAVASGRNTENKNAEAILLNQNILAIKKEEMKNANAILKFISLFIDEFIKDENS